MLLQKLIDLLKVVASSEEAIGQFSKYDFRRFHICKAFSYLTAAFGLELIFSHYF
jgi:hypothetical protein